jgi:hypothetical protein
LATALSDTSPQSSSLALVAISSERLGSASLFAANVPAFARIASRADANT